MKQNSFNLTSRGLETKVSHTESQQCLCNLYLMKKKNPLDHKAWVRFPGWQQFIHIPWWLLGESRKLYDFTESRYLGLYFAALQYSVSYISSNGFLFTVRNHHHGSSDFQRTLSVLLINSGEEFVKDTAKLTICVRVRVVFRTFSHCYVITDQLFKIPFFIPEHFFIPCNQCVT